MRVGIVAQRGNDRAVRLAADVAAALDEVRVDLDPVTAGALDRSATPVETFADADLVVSIGGDGTFLYAARHADTTPILGVNLGEVGFLNAVQPEAAVETVRAEVERHRQTGSVRATPLPRVVARGGEADDGGDAWALTPALNEVVVQGAQRGRGHGVTVAVAVDGDRYVERTVDGVLVATPAGSTAYNLSEGGPLLGPETAVLVVTPMGPAPAARPLVVPADATVSVTVTEGTDPVVLADGSRSRSLSPPAEVRVERAAEPARVAGPGVDLFGALGKLD